MEQRPLSVRAEGTLTALAGPGQPHLGLPPPLAQEPQVRSLSLSPRPCLAMPGLRLTLAPLAGPILSPLPRADLLAWPQPVPIPVKVPDAQGWGLPAPGEPWPLQCLLLLTTYSTVPATSFYNSRITT